QDRIRAIFAAPCVSSRRHQIAERQEQIVGSVEHAGLPRQLLYPLELQAHGGRPALVQRSRVVRKPAEERIARVHGCRALEDTLPTVRSPALRNRRELAWLSRGGSRTGGRKVRNCIRPKLRACQRAA